MNTYSVVDLGSLVPNGYCFPSAISPSGQQITGDAQISNGAVVPFSWDGSSISQSAALPSGFSDGYGNAINSRGDIAGSLYGPQHFQAFLIPANAPIINLHALLPGQPELRDSAALDINEAGDVVGVIILDEELNATSWLYAGGEMLDLTRSVDARIGRASSINNASQVAGTLSTDQLFVYDYQAKSLSLLPATLLSLSNLDINDVGQIAGTTPDGNAIVQKNGTIIPFTQVPYFDVRGLNNRGQVLGANYPAVYVSDPVSLSDTTAPALYDLNEMLSTPGWVIEGVDGIDDHGAIVGYGRLEGGPDRGVLLSPDSPDERARMRAAFATILFGIVNDAPGSELKGGRSPGPVDPHGPIWRALSPGQRDAIVGLAINAGAALISDRATRGEIERLSAALVQSAGARLIPSSLADRPAAHSANRSAPREPVNRPTRLRRFRNAWPTR